MEQIIEALQTLKDEGVPKNLGKKIDELLIFLRSNAELNVKKDKALSMLDDASSDPNLAADIRSQLWNISSLLESN